MREQLRPERFEDIAPALAMGGILAGGVVALVGLGIGSAPTMKAGAMITFGSFGLVFMWAAVHDE